MKTLTERMVARIRGASDKEAELLKAQNEIGTRMLAENQQLASLAATLTEVADFTEGLKSESAAFAGHIKEESEVADGVNRFVDLADSFVNHANKVADLLSAQRALEQVANELHSAGQLTRERHAQAVADHETHLNDLRHAETIGINMDAIMQASIPDAAKFLSLVDPETLRQALAALPEDRLQAVADAVLDVISDEHG